MEQDLKSKEIKPGIIRQHSFVYKFAYYLCDADNVGNTAWQLYQPIAEHKYIRLSVNTLQKCTVTSLNEDQFRVLKKCDGKFNCHLYEMLFIKELRPRLNTQSNSIKAKLLV